MKVSGIQKPLSKKEGKQLLIFKQPFWGNTGKVEFENGQVFLCKVRNSPLVKLSFFTEDRKEIVNYKLEASLNPDSVKTIMAVFPSLVPDHTLLILLILGCFAFKNIVKENQDNDFIIMVAAA